MGASVPGLVLGVAWLELRTLIAWLGVGLTGAHLIMQLLNALAVVLVFHLATQLGGRLAGAAAVWILIVRIGAPSIARTAALYNTIPLLFLGAVLLLACTAAVERPGALSVTLAALAAAVMANVHLACILTGGSVVWVALLAPRRPFRLAAFGATLFVLATFVVAPPGWLHNVTSLLQSHRPPDGVTGVVTWQSNPVVPWAVFAVGAWLASLAVRTPTWVEYRRRSQGALAVLVPFVAAFLVAPRAGLDANAKYLAHVRAACAVAAALPLAVVADALLRPLRQVNEVLSGIISVFEHSLPFALALCLPFMVTVADERTPTIGDLDTVAHILHDERGWDVERMIENVKAPAPTTILMGLRRLAGEANAPTPVVAAVGDSALLMVLELDDLPQPLPLNWKVVRRSARAAVILVLLQSRVDWKKFEVCMRPANGPEQPCVEAGWRIDETVPTLSVPNMPPSGRSRGTLKLRLPLRPAVPGSSEEIYMPRMHDICGGQIAAISGSKYQIAADRRSAALMAPEPGQTGPSTIEIEWHLDSPECSVWAYDGLPPFFVEGDAASVRLMAAILRKREG